MNKCASPCMRENETSRGTVMPVVFSFKCWAVGHIWVQSISGLLSCPPVRLQKWMEQQGGEGSRVLFTNERKAEGVHKAMLNFQSLGSPSLLRRICIFCSHHLSFLLQRSLWQKGAVPWPYSAGFGCLLHLICRERQSLSSSCCSCLLHAIFFSCSLSIPAHLTDSAENHQKLDFPSLIPLCVHWIPEHWQEFPFLPFARQAFHYEPYGSWCFPHALVSEMINKGSLHSHAHIGIKQASALSSTDLCRCNNVQALQVYENDWKAMTAKHFEVGKAVSSDFKTFMVLYFLFLCLLGLHMWTLQF